MKTVRMNIDRTSQVLGCIDPERVDATNEKDIAAQKALDDAESRQESARFVRQVRKQLGLSQA